MTSLQKRIKKKKKVIHRHKWKNDYIDCPRCGCGEIQICECGEFRDVPPTLKGRRNELPRIQGRTTKVQGAEKP